jgi:UDP-N-acetylenolpyruvoylglucosamine reductase
MKKKNLPLAFAVGILFTSLNAKPFIPETKKIEDPIIKREVMSIFETKEMKDLEKKAYDYFNYKTSDFHKDSEQVLLARMLTGEADECSDIEKIAIAYTAINRKKWGMSLKEVILYPNAYSCFNPEFDSSTFLKDPLRYDKTEFLNCLKISAEILDGKYKDPTKGATFYYNPNLVKKPKWTRGLIKVGRIKNSHHIFYKESLQ